jgi:hypothetical protein
MDSAGKSSKTHSTEHSTAIESARDRKLVEYQSMHTCITDTGYYAHVMDYILSELPVSAIPRAVAYKEALKEQGYQSEENSK